MQLGAYVKSLLQGIYLTNDCIWHLLKIYIIYVGVVVVETLVFRMQIIINYKSLFHLLPVLS